MLTEIYIKALLVDEELADQVWELWDAVFISDELATVAWCLIATDHPLIESASSATYLI